MNLKLNIISILTASLYLVSTYVVCAMVSISWIFLTLCCFISLVFGDIFVNSIINNNVSRNLSSKKKCAFHWLHPPKISSTFCLSLQHACNETRFMEYAKISTHTKLQFGCVQMKPKGSAEGSRNHDPIDVSDIEMDKIKNYVTLLKEPSSRIIASFVDGLQGDGLSIELKQELMNKMDFEYGYGKERRDDGWKGKWGQSESLCLKNFNIFATFPSSYGCYTKMLNGYACMSNITITQNMVDDAIELMKQFLFVGLTEDYELSVKMFLNKAFQSDAVDPTTRLIYNNSNSNNSNTDNSNNKKDLQLQQKVAGMENVNIKHIQLHDSELIHMKTGSHLCAPILTHLLELKNLNYTDPYDSIIYKEAMRLFLKEREIYESQLP